MYAYGCVIPLHAITSYTGKQSPAW